MKLSRNRISPFLWLSFIFSVHMANPCMGTLISRAGFVRSWLFLPHRLTGRNQILHVKYYFSLLQAKRNPVLLNLTVKMTSYWCRGTFALCKLLVINDQLKCALNLVDICLDDTLQILCKLLLCSTKFWKNYFKILKNFACKIINVQLQNSVSCSLLVPWKLLQRFFYCFSCSLIG